MKTIQKSKLYQTVQQIPGVRKTVAIETILCQFIVETGIRNARKFALINYPVSADDVHFRIEI